ncbi:MAG: KamA family radical SAM protein [Acidobacteria bacterium]|nr:KamA family radical SAM protein [Acidobacteriota bacterium]
MKQEAFASVAEPLAARREEICAVVNDSYDPATWGDWRWQMRHRLTRLDQFDRLLRLTEPERRGLTLASEKFSVAVTPYFAALIDPEDPDCPIRRQVVPVEGELVVSPGDMTDPLDEDGASVVEGLVHRYPDRVLFLVLDTCAAYCRYCTRSRLVSQGELEPLGRRVEAVIAYLQAHHEVRDVLLSGGDPLLMSDATLDKLLGRLREIPHLEFLRIGTRIPCFVPQRITPELVAVLRKHRVWLSVHFCHARELTPEVAQAADLLADGGIPLGCQTVLLKGVNDSVPALRDLFHGLLKLRIRPYYLYQCDPVLGTGHLRTSVGAGLAMIEQLRGHTTGYAVPTYVVDAPGGGGKIPVQTETIVGHDKGVWQLRNWAGKVYSYRDPHAGHAASAGSTASAASAASRVAPRPAPAAAAGRRKAR